MRKTRLVPTLQAASVLNLLESSFFSHVSEVLLFLRSYFIQLFDEWLRHVPVIAHLGIPWQKVIDIMTYASESVFVFPVLLLPFSAAVFALLALLHFEFFGLWAMMSFWLTIWHPIFLPSYFTVLLFVSRRAKFSL